MAANSSEDTLPRLGNLLKVRPRRASRLIRLIWPDIQAALEVGHTLKFVHQRLRESGVSISYNQFTVYVSRLRRESAMKNPYQESDRVQPRTGIRESEDESLGGGPDPLKNYRERCIHKPSGFRSDGGRPDKEKLI